MSKITFEDIYRTVEDLVEAEPKRTNGFCSHYDNITQEPVCIVGHVFDVLSEVEPHLKGVAKDHAFAHEAAKAARFDSASRAYLTILQNHADEGSGDTVNWATAKRRADKTFGLVNADA